MLYDKEEIIYRQNNDQINSDDDKSELISFILGIISFLVLFFVNPIFSVVISGVGLYFGIRSNTILNIIMHALIICVFVIMTNDIFRGL